MKKIIANAVSVFSPSTSTITLDIDNFDVRNLYAIINQTNPALIYATATQGKGYSSVVGNTIVLQYDCNGMGASDNIQVIYDDSEDIDLLNNIFLALKDLSFLASVRGVSSDLRTTVINTVPTTISSGTVSNLAAVGGFSANAEVPAIQNIATAQGNINNIQVTIS